MNLNARPPVRLWIDDHHPIMRRGLTSCLLAEGLKVIGESSHFRPEPILDQVDVVVFEADVEGLRKAVRLVHQAAMVALMRDPDEALLMTAFDAGVAAVVLQDELSPRNLASTVRNVAAGNASLPATLVPRLLERASRAPRGPNRAHLATRELDVLKLLADGEGTRSIADQLAYSERTVKNVVHDLLVKMNCRNRAHAVATATRQGII